MLSPPRRVVSENVGVNSSEGVGRSGPTPYNILKHSLSNGQPRQRRAQKSAAWRYTFPPVGKGEENSTRFVLPAGKPQVSPTTMEMYVPRYQIEKGIVVKSRAKGTAVGAGCYLLWAAFGAQDWGLVPAGISYHARTLFAVCRKGGASAPPQNAGGI